ncbi:MAG: phosphoribosyl-ATP diphosphatase [Alphaproteobacteria bacterium]
MTQDLLNWLYERVEQKKGDDPSNSYTARLLAGSMAKMAQKVGEEAVETLIEALQGNREKLLEESADLLYHLMVLWSASGVTPDDVAQILYKRAEK